MTSVATSGFGVLLKMDDGGVGAGVQASKTVGSSNQQIVCKDQNAGAAGNAMTFGILVSGVSTAFSFAISHTSLVITSATDGSSLATTTVNEAIYQIQDNAIYRTDWELTRGAGNGTGVLVASATSALSGGSDGSVFTTIAEVKSISGPDQQAGIIDVTNMDSPNNTREFLPNLIDPGTLSFDINFLPGNTGHQALQTVLTSRAKRNFRLIYTNSPANQADFAGYVTGLSISAGIEDALSASITVKLTSSIVNT